MNTYVSNIRNFFFENFIFDTDESLLDNDASLLEQGIIDSTGVMEVAAWLEEEYDLTIDDEEIIPQNMGSINNLAVFISTKVVLNQESDFAATAIA